MELCEIERFDCDVTYGNGQFYKGMLSPFFCFDIDGATLEEASCSSDSVKGVCSSDNLPIPDGSINSLVFDPPFLTYIKAARTGNGNMVMAKRFGGYWRYDELEAHYRSTLEEAYRVLGKKGIMVFKCQDIIHNHKMHCTHANVIEWASGMFRLKDLFVLPVKHRMPVNDKSGEKKKGNKNTQEFITATFLSLKKKLIR